MQVNSVAAGITIGVLGGGLFGTGFLMSMEPLTITGIVLLAISILIFCILFLIKKPSNPVTESANPIRHSPPNALGMKRNKSDTDLELMRDVV